MRTLTTLSRIGKSARASCQASKRNAPLGCCAEEDPITLPAHHIQQTWLKQSQVAEDLQVSEPTVGRMIARGELPAYRVGAQIRIKAEDVQRISQPVEVA